MNKNKLSMLGLALLSLPAFAGTMGAATSEKFFLIEGGVAYSHVFYKNRALFPESISTLTPRGFYVNPSKLYPPDFFGGYAGLSFYFPGWLLNSRYTILESRTRVNDAVGTSIKLQPAKLAFTVDKVLGDINFWSYGIGGGAIIEANDQGQARVVVNTFNPPSKSIQGRSIIDPLVEGFVMVRFSNNLGVKFNLGYQIPVGNTFGDGDLNLNLGINYALPI